MNKKSTLILVAIIIIVPTLALGFLEKDSIIDYIVSLNYPDEEVTEDVDEQDQEGVVEEENTEPSATKTTTNVIQEDTNTQTPETNESTTLFTDPYGIYSLRYPSDWVLYDYENSENDKIPVQSWEEPENGNSFVAGILPFSIVEKYDIEFTESVLLGKRALKGTKIGFGGGQTVYMIDLEEEIDIGYGNDDLYMMITSEFSDDETLRVINTIKFQYTEESLSGMVRDIEDSLTEARESAQDASAKASLSSMRAASEIWWANDDTDGYYNPSTKKGVCTPGEQPYDLLEKAGEIIGKPFICNHSIQAYAAEIELNTGERFCVDSTGYAGTSKSPLGSGLTCKK